MTTTTRAKPAAKAIEAAADKTDVLLLRFARARLAELRASDRACLMHLLDAGKLAEHLVERGRAAATHYRRLLTRNSKPEDADKEVTAQWVSATAAGETPDPLPDGRQKKLEAAVGDFLKGAGRIFAAAS